MEAELERLETYQTTNQTYGQGWEAGFQGSFSQSVPCKQLTNRRQVSALPNGQLAVSRERQSVGLSAMSNVPTNTRGEFTNVRRDLWADRQGLYSNSMFNTPEATIDRGLGTYSNLQGAWGRIGPSTYDAMHGNGSWVNQWPIRSVEASTLRSLYDHRNVDPRDGLVPIENTPQNHPYTRPM